MKNVFYTTSKALSVLKIFKVLSRLFVMYQNNLIKKIRLISKFITSQPGQQTIVIHILHNLSRSKGNQTMNCCQLIECNMRNIFLEKSCTNCGGKTAPKPFSKNLKMIISLDHQPKVLYRLYGKLRAFIVWQVEGY